MSDTRGKARSPWRRRALVALLVAMALPFVLGVALLGSLRLGSVRRAIADRVERGVLDSLELELHVDDFRLDPLAGELTAEGLAIGVPGASPVLKVPHLEVTFDTRSLTTRHVVVHSVTVISPHVDLAAPLPDLPRTTEESGASSPRTFEVSRFEVRDGSISPGLVPEALREQVLDWKARGIEAHGSLVADTLELNLAVAHILVHRSGGARHDATLAASLRRAPSGEVDLSKVRLSAGGLELAGQARGALTDTPAFSGSFDVTVEPAVLAPELRAGGHVTATGTFDTRATTATVSFRALGVSADAIEPYVDPGLFASAEAAGTSVDVTAELTAGPGDWMRLAGDVEASWTRSEALVVDATAHLSPDGRDGVSLRFDVSLLPEWSGARSATGTLSGRGWSELASGTLADTVIHVSLPEIGTAYAEARALWPRLVPELGPEIPVFGALDADVRLDGPLASPRADATLAWVPEENARIAVHASGAPMERRGEAEVTVERLRLGLLRSDLEGTVSATAQASGTPASYTAAASVNAEGLLVLPDAPRLETLSLEASTDGHRVELTSLSGSSEGRLFSGHGWFPLDLPVRHAFLSAHLENPVPQVETADLAVTLEDGVLHLDVPGIDTRAGSAALAADLPLAALARMPELAGALADAPLVMADGPVLLSFNVPEIDTCTLSPLLGLEDRAERLRAGLHGSIWIDLEDVAAAIGDIYLTGLLVEPEGHRIHASGPLRLRLGNHRLELLPGELIADETGLAIEAQAALTAGWQPRSDPPAGVVQSFSAAVSGMLDSTLANPYLVGGVASGPLYFEVLASGTPDQPRVEASLFGPDTSFFWPTPYATRLERPDLYVVYEDGAARLEHGSATLNGGTLSLSGGRSSSGEIAGAVTLEDVRYRLDYGVTVVLGGEVALLMPPDERGEMAGTIVVQRGLLTRDIDLDREIASFLLAPAPSTGTESNILDTIDLDIAIETVSGVRVKNNVADLKVTWDDLRVGGTAWNPVVRGSAEVDPGGLVFAFGQTVRLDRAVFTFTGDPLTDPQIDLETTSSLQDPNVALLPAQASPLAALAETDAATQDAGETLATGVASYYGEQVASKVTQSLGLGTVSMRPLLIFGETDPGTRLTVVRDFSRNVAFAFSLDLRNAQRQTYLLDLHGFHRAPGFSAQVFTTDQGNVGGTLQHSLQLGGPRRPVQEGPRLDRIRLARPEGVPKRALRAAVGLSKGDTVPEGAIFDIEVEVAALLRERGYPDPQVKVSTAPSSRHDDRVDLVVAIEPGPHVRFVFAGDRPPRGSRTLITSLYRTDYYEAASLDEMRRATVRTFRALGHLDPQVGVEVARDDTGGPLAERTVTITTEAGAKVALGTPVFLGAGEEEARLLASRFPGPLERAELALGVADADRRVRESLRVLGYPDGRVVSRELSVETGTLTVTVAPGRRRTVGTVTITGLAPEQHESTLAKLPIAAGDPARADRIALAALSIEQDLRDQGFADARARVSSSEPDGDGAVDVTFQVTPGQAFTIGQVEFTDARYTSPSLLRRVADLEPGSLLRTGDVSLARGRLSRMGLFSAVTARTEKLPDGQADVTFSLTEQPRFTIAYGARYESSVGPSGVVDFMDGNFLGRAVSVGVRASYEPDDTRGRLYVGASDLLGTRASFQVFAERRRRVQGNIQTDSLETTLQLAHPVGSHATARVYGAYLDRHLTEVVPDPWSPVPLDVRITLPYLGTQLIYDTRADPLLATEGVFASADLQGSDTFMGSDFRYLRFYGQLNLYRPLRLGSLTTTWAQSVRVGLAKPFGQELISDVRFFAGGEFSVRGYPFEGLGPVEELGTVERAAGGEALFILNEELRVPLPWDLTGLVFVDVGQVWASPSDFGRDLAKALGLGLRANTPLGVLRFDAAYPFDRRANEPRYKLYFGFGHAF